MGTTSFVQLDVWKAAHKVVLDTYRLTQKFPAEEKYGLAAQMRRAAVSIPANIAEGYGRRRPHDKTRLYNISNGSAEEVKYYLILAKDLGYDTKSDDLFGRLEDVSRMLRALTRAIDRNA